MKPKKRQKMCYNCEGGVDLDVIVCPFCAADLRAEKPEQQASAYNPASSVKALNPAPGNAQTCATFSSSPAPRTLHASAS